MTVIICTDDDFGMTFFGKRQSSDRVLTERILKNENLVISPFSAKLFEEYNVKTDPDFLSNAGDTDVCFTENADITDYIEKISKIILYKWNRRYPSDKKFNKALLSGFTLVSAEDFAGYSHEKITEEIYEKC